jgi:TonB-linked SusC/RagA family outer membrane protein
LPLTALGQTGDIAGTVTDAESGEPVPAANVGLVEINRGQATDADGNYRIEDVPIGTYTLRVSFVGYQSFTTELTVEGGATVTQDVALEPGAVGLDEVVVTSYGQQQTAGEVTGSVSRVSSQDIQDVPAQNAEGLLQGRAAGVTLSTTSGNPGGGFEFDIRGAGSISAGTEPLYIVDGVQISQSAGSALTDRSPLNAIDPSNIESIQILKDAAAAAIYGAQAANGVVLIETKTGREGPVQVSVNFEGGTRFQSRRFDMAERDEWVELQQDAFRDYPTFGFRENILPAFGYDSDADVSELRDFDWQDWLFEPGAHSKFGFSASGGDAQTQFFIAGSRTKTGGALPSSVSSYRNYTFRTNLDQQFTDRLSVSAKVNLSSEQQRNVCQDGFFINCPFYQSIGEEPPISFPYNDDGTYNPNTEQSSTTNPALFLNEERRVSDITQIIGNVQPRYQVTPWLSARASFGLDFQSIEDQDNESTVRAPGDGGTAFRRFEEVTNLTFSGTLNADKTFAGRHDVSGLLGTEYRREHEEFQGFSAAGFNNDLITVPSGATRNTGFFGLDTEFRILSYFGRVNYTYDNRYILTFTTRYDGSSRFGNDQRWGLFPSGSVGWRISEEDFFTADWVESLKVRASLGITGNSAIGNFPARGLYNVTGNYLGQVGIRPGQLANPSLSWEENRGINLGVDYSLFRGRISGSLEAYQENNNELLLARPLPTSSGFGAITENIGETRNRGIEFQISTVNVQTDRFRWSTRFNFSVTQNTVLDLTGDADELFPDAVVPIAVGQSQEAWNVPIWAGVNPADGRPMWYDKDGHITYQPTQADRKFVNGAEEDIVGGFGTNVSYGGLSLDAFLDYSFGAQSLPNTMQTFTDPFGENVLEFVANERWREPGDVARYPRAAPFGAYDLIPGVPASESPDIVSTNWLYKNNYIRLRSISLSYELPERVLNQVSLRGARVYVSGSNLLQISPYLGIDPEVADTEEESSYPAEQQFNIGIELDI